MRQFEIDATNPVQPRVTVDGVEQTGLTRISVDIPELGNYVPQLYLTYARGGKFVGSGDVTVTSAGPDAIRAWLTTVNPSALEDAALAAEQASGGPMSPGAMFKAGMLALLEAQSG
ncbi:hypothetical protein MXD62_19445 [Frankia sp. Mgl5]|uniref:hypothetical protein n=1 Tax=Frankia sp. Mgl5 TaxID=2933793 RepID=UPI0020101647|nr:hypothetical protein [Frankia sp. Mgl5]MCK9929327.1 hypothetical protein [Frankia sp. Mgl5]